MNPISSIRSASSSTSISTLRKSADAIPDQIEQSPRRGNEDINAATKHIGLWTHAHTAVNDGKFKLHMLAVNAEAVGDLGGEFAVGQRTRQRGRATPTGRVTLERRWRIGSANAASFPCRSEQASKSRPRNT